jgi:broad specificity phosphatase PhoE
MTHSKPMRTLILVRHGETNENKAIRFQGHSGGPLNEVGRTQAAACCARLSKMPVVACMSSDLIRASETADILCAGHANLKPQHDARLREVDVGAWAGLNRDALLEKFPSEYRAWELGIDVRRGGGETYGEVASRMLLAIEEFDARSPPGALLIVSHGGAIRSALARLLGLPQNHLTSIRNTAISQVDFYPGSGLSNEPNSDDRPTQTSAYGVLRVFNDVQHLGTDPLFG